MMSITVPAPGAPPGYTDRPSVANTAEQVTLDVSGRRFVTTIPSLTFRSQYFLTFFRSDWQSTLQPDGAIFIDSDPEVFGYILKYLRRGVFPLAYDQNKGHDYKLYADILADAQHFQIPKLESWLAWRLYLNCITICTVWSSSKHKDEKSQGSSGTRSTWLSDVVSTQLVRDEITTVRTPVCPHVSSERAMCTKKMCAVGGGYQDDSETYRWAEVGKRVIFHHDWCSDTGKSFAQYWESHASRPTVMEKSHVGMAERLWD